MLKTRLYSSTGLIVLAVAFLVFCAFNNHLFKGTRIDLTEQKIYTISQGTQHLLANLAEPITISFFYSQKAINDSPEYKGFLGEYANNVQELLEKYVYFSNGKLKLEIIDPEPFSEAEDKAVENGIRAIPIKNGLEQFYLGVAVNNPAKKLDKSIGFLDPEKEATLEYDLTQLIYQVIHDKKPVLGLVTSLPMQGSFDYTTGQPTRAWVMYDQLKQFYDVKMLSANDLTISDDIDLLMLAYPKKLDDSALYAIDQYVLKGGKIIVVVDPFAEADRESANPMMAPSIGSGADFSKLFTAWGIGFDASKVLLDRTLGVTVPLGQGQAPQKVMTILAAPKTQINSDDVSTALLDNLYFSSAGAITPLEGASTEFTPLVQSTADSMLVDRTKIENQLNLPKVQRDFVADDKTYTLIARVSGPVKSAFTEAPKKEEAKKDESKPDEAKTDVADEKSPVAEKPVVPHLAQSSQPIQVLLIADADFLSDRLWVQVQEFYGQALLNVFAHNGNLMLNVIDNMTGSSELVGLRSRNIYTRPFTKFHELKQNAEQTLQAQEVALNTKLEETQRKLNELQMGNKEGQGETLTPEQLKTIETFQHEMLETRKALRSVRHQLEQDIDALKLKITVLNIAGIPAILILLALGLWGLRRIRR